MVATQTNEHISQNQKTVPISQWGLPASEMYRSLKVMLCNWKAERQSQVEPTMNCGIGIRSIAKFFIRVVKFST